jgi:hypothetical protein
MLESKSQNGEDLIVAACFQPDYKGTLLEIGAWFPIEFSNSRLLIEAGWDATLVEFSPLAVDRQLREYGYNERVKIIQAAITPGPQHVIKFNVTEDALSSDDPTQVAIWKDMRPGYSGGFYGNLWVPTISIDALLSQFFGDRRIDFASIDTEGSSVELAIALMRTDHRPKVLCVEHNGKIVELMGAAQGYGYKNIHTSQENVILCR